MGLELKNGVILVDGEKTTDQEKVFYKIQDLAEEGDFMMVKMLK